MNDRREAVSLYFDAEQIAHLRRLAKQLRISYSEIVRASVMKCIPDIERLGLDFFVDVEKSKRRHE